jgi:hypothetical protein
MWDLESLGECGAVTRVPIEELDDARGSPSTCARSSASGQWSGSTSQTLPSAASACDVRVIASSAIQPKPSAPRSSQKRNLTSAKLPEVGDHL